MPKIVAHLPKTSLKLFLFPEDINPAIEKKLAKLGGPGFWMNFSFDKKLNMKDLGDNKFQYISGDLGESIPLIAPTDRGVFSAKYNPEDHSIVYDLEGEFLVYGGTDNESAAVFKKITIGYIAGSKILDSKGKPIQKPKNEFGMSFPLEATTIPGKHDTIYIGIKLSIQAE